MEKAGVSSPVVSVLNSGNFFIPEVGSPCWSVPAGESLCLHRHLHVPHQAVTVLCAPWCGLSRREDRCDSASVLCPLYTLSPVRHSGAQATLESQ